MLLFGATGSGKTEVYLRAAAKVLASDASAQALVMVPEINLTPQLEARFADALRRPPHRRAAQRPDAGAAPAKSWLAPHRRRRDLCWARAWRCSRRCPRLGLIVVDEEHDPSYKQQEGARYSARDLAVYRGRLEARQGAAGLGHAVAGKLAAREPGALPAARAAAARIGGGALPAVRLVDMNQQPKNPCFRRRCWPPCSSASRAASKAWCS